MREQSIEKPMTEACKAVLDIFEKYDVSFKNGIDILFGIITFFMMRVLELNEKDHAKSSGRVSSRILNSLKASKYSIGSMVYGSLEVANLHIKACAQLKEDHRDGVTEHACNS